MILCNVVVLLICVSFSSNVKAQEVVITSSNCDNEYVYFYRCMIQCCKTEYGITKLTEEDFCNNGVLTIIEGYGPDSFTKQDVKQVMQCATGQCQSDIPLSVCGDDSSIITKLTDAEFDGNSVEYSALVSHIRSEHRRHTSHQSEHRRHTSHQSEHRRRTSHKNSHRQVSKKKNMHYHERIRKQKHLATAFANTYGIKEDQYGALLKKIKEDSRTQKGQKGTSGKKSGETGSSGSKSGGTDSSGSQSGEADDSETQSGEELLTKIVEAARNLPEETDASGTKTEKVAEILTKLVKDSGVQTDEDNAAASALLSALLSTLLDTFGLQIGQFNELLKILEEVSGKKTGQLEDVHEILETLESGGYSNDSGEQYGDSGEQYDYSGEYYYDSGEYYDNSTEYYDNSTEYYDNSTEYYDNSTAYYDDSVEYSYDSGHYSNDSGNYFDDSYSNSEKELFGDYFVEYTGEGTGGPGSSGLVQNKGASGLQSGQSVISFEPQPGSFAYASGPQSSAFASASGPLSNGPAPAQGDYSDDCEMSGEVESSDSSKSSSDATASDSNNTPASDATLGSTVSVSSPDSFATDTTFSDTSRTASTAASDSTGTSLEGSTASSLSKDSTTDEYLDDCDDYGEVSNSRNVGDFQSASAVAIASISDNSANSQQGGINYPPNSIDDDFNTTYDSYTHDYNTTYDDSYETYRDYDNSAFANISYGYLQPSSEESVNSSEESSSGGSANAFAESSSGGRSNAFADGQGNGQNPNIQPEYQSSSRSVGGVPVNPNPIIQPYETNGKNVGGILTGGDQNTGFLNTPLQNIGFNQNPTSTNYGTGVNVNGQSPFPQNQGQSQSIISQIQGIYQRPAILQNQGVIVASGQTPGQYANSFTQNQGFYNNPISQQQSNNYGSGVATNQQSLGQFPNTRNQSPFVSSYSPSSFSVGTISSSGSGSSVQMQPISANVPAQNQAFLGNGLLPNIPQSNGFAPQTNAGGSYPIRASSSAGAVSNAGGSSLTQVSAGNVPIFNQAFKGGNFGPPSYNPQMNVGGINYNALANAMAGSFARNGNSGQTQVSSINVPVQSQPFTRSNLGYGPVVNIPQYNGNVAQINSGGIGQIARAFGLDNFASSTSSSGANSGYNNFFNGPRTSINSQSIGGNVPTNSGSPVNTGSLDNSRSLANSGNFANAWSSANSGNFADAGN